MDKKTPAKAIRDAIEKHLASRRDDPDFQDRLAAILEQEKKPHR